MNADIIITAILIVPMLIGIHYINRKPIPRVKHERYTI